METLSRDVAILQTDMKWVKEIVSKLDRRTWFIVTGIVITILITLINLLS